MGRHEIWAVILVFGLWGWIVSTLTFIFTSFRMRGGFDARSALKWGLCVLASFAVWVTGLLMA